MRSDLVGQIKYRTIGGDIAPFTATARDLSTYIIGPRGRTVACSQSKTRFGQPARRESGAGDGERIVGRSFGQRYRTTFV